MSEIDSDNDDDTHKLPSKKGKKWTDDEQEQMLTLIGKKKSIEDISEILERTPGGVKSHLEKMVYDSFTHNEATLDEISKWSGLTKEEIDYAITMNAKRASKPKPTKEKHTELTDLKQIIALLTDIQAKVNKMMEKYEPSPNITKPKPQLEHHSIVVVKPAKQIEQMPPKVIIMKGTNK